jgi:RNA-directed DNA polymerase
MMSKAMRQMLEQSGREGVARGEAACDLFSDEACGPPLEHRGAGLMALVTGTGAGW